MIYRISLVAISMFVAACASSGPDAPVTNEPEAAAALAPGESSAVDTPNAEAVASTEAKDYDPNELVCRRERATGTKLAKKTCYTRAQLEERAEQDQAALTQMRNQRSGGQQDTNPGGG